MKKSLSIILSAVMLICSVSFATSVFAYSKNDAPLKKEGETFSITAPGVEMGEDDGADSYFAKFVPGSTGYYEFVFDTKYEPEPDPNADASISMAFSIVVDAKDNPVAMGVAAFASDGTAEDENESPYPSCCGELKAGSTYYLVVANYSSGSYTSNVTINKHTHHLYDSKEKSPVYTDLSKNEDGYYYTGCDKNGCIYAKINKVIKKVKSISLSSTKYTYNGKEKKPAVTVKDSKGNDVPKSNYTVEYSNNKKVGTGKVTIKFKNDYYGKVTKTFRINPASTSIASISAKKKGFTVKWKKQANQTSGYQVQYATDSKFESNRKTLTVSKNSTVSKTVSKLKGKKKYYVRVRTYKTVDGNKYYSSWSKAKAVTTKK